MKHYLNYLNSFCPNWLIHYQKQDVIGDLIAGIIVSLLLIPQGLAYAMLAGLPPEHGLYASFIPLILYAFLGSSRQSSVGPMAVTALMTASAIAPLAQLGSPEAIKFAMGLAFLSGVFLCVFSIFKLGAIANYLSAPVITGFTSASVILIIASQLSNSLGISIKGRTLPEIMYSLFNQIHMIHIPTLYLSLGSLLFLWCSKKYLKSILNTLGFSNYSALLISRLMPALLVLVGIGATQYWRLDELFSWKTIGTVPNGFPALIFPSLSLVEWQSLFLPALLLAFMNFVQSFSVAQALAIKKGEKVNANQELNALGISNLSAGLLNGMPVTGGLSRSALNAEAGANTQLSSLITGLILGALLIIGTDFLSSLPHAILSATIIIAVSSMFSWQEIRRIWRYDRADGWAMVATFFMLLFIGVGESILIGVLTSLGFMIWRSSHPHMVEIGRIPNTEHFRNKLRYPVELMENVSFLRIDEQLYFANVQLFETFIYTHIEQKPHVKHLVLVMSAVNGIDSTAFEQLLIWQKHLNHRHISLHLAEIKGPVLDRLRTNEFDARFSGKLFLSTHEAWNYFTQQKN